MMEVKERWIEYRNEVRKVLRRNRKSNLKWAESCVGGHEVFKVTRLQGLTERKLGPRIAARGCVESGTADGFVCVGAFSSSGLNPS